jgi:hypothetical protein
MIRRIVLGYCSQVCLGNGKVAYRAWLVLNAFRDEWDREGKAGLVRSAYEAVHAK